MAQAALTERQLREREYYDHFVARSVVDVGSLAAVRGEERRPWNPYWFVTEMVRERFTTPTQRILDFGCGPGTYSVQFAHLGYRVTGFDVSPGNVETARALAARYGMSERTRFDVGLPRRLTIHPRISTSSWASTSSTTSRWRPPLPSVCVC